MALTMTKEEREAFLADIHVAVISVAEDGHGPLVVPIWYSYEPGGAVRIITGRASRKSAVGCFVTTGNENKVGRATPAHLVRDVDIAALGVLRVR